jgi:AGZA family xanthine/uracil permease-like MFS transporter
MATASHPDAPTRGSAAPRWFVRGDIDGFFGLALDNLIQVLVIIALCTDLLGFSANLVYGRILPGIAVSLIAGNLFYAWQAHGLARRSGRHDVCALPYGINTVSLFAYALLVMLPVKKTAEASGIPGEQASELAFRAGLVAAIGSGIIEAAGAWAVKWLRRWTPRAAMLSTLAGIAVTFIAAGFLFQTFASPLVAFLPLGVVILTYFGKVRFPGGLPGGAVALLLGTLAAWATPLLDWDQARLAQAAGYLGLHPPLPLVASLLGGFGEGYLWSYFAIILPMGLFNVVGSLQNLDSAAAAGDDYPTVPSLLANGIGTLLGACFGNPFPTTIYIGHPGWKALGARVGYSVLNAIFFTLLGLCGAAALVAALVPIEAGMAIVLWIGIIMVSQSFTATEPRHAPAVAIGLLPGIAAWGALALKQGLRAAGLGSAEQPFSPALLDSFARGGVYAHGAFALEQGFLLTSMIWAALTVEVIDRRFWRAALWAGAGALLSWLGLIHAYDWQLADTVQQLSVGHAWKWAVGYALLAALLLLGNWLKVDEQPGH